MKRIMYLLVLVVFASCANSKFIALGSNSYPPINEKEVTIFLSESDLPKEYEKVAIISTQYTPGNDKTMWISVKKKCAQNGCNGVFMTKQKNASVAEKIFIAGSTDKAEFVAIRYKKQ